MAHQVARNAGAVFPPVAPPEEPLGIEGTRLVFGIRQKTFPVDVLARRFRGTFVDVVLRVELPFRIRVGAIDVHADHRARAEDAALVQLSRLLEVGHAVVVMAELQDSLIVLYGFADRLGLAQRAAKALLAVDILLVVGRRDRHGRVPEIRRGDDDHVHVLVRHGLLPLAHQPHVGVLGLLARALRVGLVEVANDAHLGIRARLYLFQKLKAAGPDAYAGDSERVVRTLLCQHGRRARQGGGDPGASGLQEISSLHEFSPMIRNPMRSRVRCRPRASGDPFACMPR